MEGGGGREGGREGGRRREGGREKEGGREGALSLTAVPRGTTPLQVVTLL